MQWRSATVFSAPSKRLGGATSVFESPLDGGIVSYHPGGSSVSVESWTGEGAYLSSTALPEDMSAACLNPDGEGEVYVGGACFVSRWLLGGQGPLVRVRDPKATVRFLAALPGGRVVSAGLGGVQAWDLARPFPRRDATASESEAACLWRGTLPRGVGDIQSLCVVPMPSGQVIVAVGGELGGGVCLWDGGSGECLGLLWALDEEGGSSRAGAKAPPPSSSAPAAAAAPAATAAHTPRKRAPAASLLALPGGFLAVGGPGVVWLWHLGTRALMASLMVSVPGGGGGAPLSPHSSSSSSTLPAVFSPGKSGEVMMHHHQHPQSPRPPTLSSPRISSATSSASSSSGAGLFTSLTQLQGGAYLAASLDVGTPMGAIYTWSTGALIGGGGDTVLRAPSSPNPSDAPIFTPTSVILPPSLGSMGAIGSNLRTTALLGLRDGSFLSASPDGTLLLWASTDAPASANVPAFAPASASVPAPVPSFAPNVFSATTTATPATASAATEGALSPRGPMLSPRAAPPPTTTPSTTTPIASSTTFTGSAVTSPLPPPPSLAAAAAPSAPPPPPLSPTSPRQGGGAFDEHSHCLPPTAVAAAVAAAEARVAQLYSARLAQAQMEAEESIRAAVEDAVEGVLSSAGMRVAVAEGEVERLREEVGRLAGEAAEARAEVGRRVECEVAAAAAASQGEREKEKEKEGSSREALEAATGRAEAAERALEAALDRAESAERALSSEREEYECERRGVQCRLSAAFDAGAESGRVVWEERVAGALASAAAAEGELARSRAEFEGRRAGYKEKLGLTQTQLMEVLERFHETQVRAASKDEDVHRLVKELESFKARLAAASAATDAAKATAAAIAYQDPPATTVPSDALAHAVPATAPAAALEHEPVAPHSQLSSQPRAFKDPFEDSSVCKIILPRKKDDRGAQGCCTIA